MIRSPRPGPSSRAAALLAATAVLLAGCTGSVLVRPDDVLYQRATARLEKTRAAVTAVPGTGTDAAMFLQAEAFYRYRFEPPARGVGNYILQGLAVASEFAPLQALAASAGMFDLRLRAYDGAVQIWETLLLQHPQSPLRPLALYRLGWAYRSVYTGGFPREEPEEAFAELLRAHPDSSLVSLARAAEQVAWKSQDTAIGLSIVPGAGQMYAGEWGNGVARLGIALACAGVAVAPVFVLYDKWQEDRFFEGQNWAWAGTSLLGIILLNVAYTSAYQDAQRAVVLHNEAAEARFEDQHPEAP